MSGGFLQYDPDVICKMIQVCGVLYNFLLELRDEGDGEEAEPDVDPRHAAPQQGAQPQDDEAEFQGCNSIEYQTGFIFKMQDTMEMMSILYQILPLGREREEAR